jgi:hypothetical protein
LKVADLPTPLHLFKMKRMEIATSLLMVTTQPFFLLVFPAHLVQMALGLRERVEPHAPLTIQERLD